MSHEYCLLKCLMWITVLNLEVSTIVKKVFFSIVLIFVVRIFESWEHEFSNITGSRWQGKGWVLEHCKCTRTVAKQMDGSSLMIAHRVAVTVSLVRFQPPCKKPVQKIHSISTSRYIHVFCTAVRHNNLPAFQCCFGNSAISPFVWTQSDNNIITTTVLFLLQQHAAWQFCSCPFCSIDSLDVMICGALGPAAVNKEVIQRFFQHLFILRV